MWADPVDDDDSQFMTDYSFNDDRNCSVFFGSKAT
jgi:hypothetical protein